MRRERSHVPPLGWQVRSIVINARDGPERVAQAYALLLAPMVQSVQRGETADARADSRQEHAGEHPSADPLSSGASSEARGVNSNQNSKGDGYAGGHLRPRLDPAPGARPDD
jgi:hypothetical protein